MVVCVSADLKFVFSVKPEVGPTEIEVKLLIGKTLVLVVLFGPKSISCADGADYLFSKGTAREF